jgi:aminoglycoside phosphotransferase (APT) family kinase protein
MLGGYAGLDAFPLDVDGLVEGHDQHVTDAFADILSTMHLVPDFGLAVAGG